MTPSLLLTSPFQRVVAVLCCLPIPGLIIVPALSPSLWVTVLLGLLISGVLFFQARRVAQQSSNSILG